MPSRHTALESECDRCGSEYEKHRDGIMASQGIGLTAAYNQLHDQNDSSQETRRFRDLQVEMDEAIAAAYGWTDLELCHDFHVTKQGVRFTISEPARREVLQRLLKLNHERYAEEVKQGLHGKKGAKKGRRTSGRQERTLFGTGGD